MITTRLRNKLTSCQGN